MSQHDYEIANQLSSNLRTDLNNALGAIVSTNSGASAPLTTFANMIYYNTSDNTLYKRNEADTDPWIALGTVDESLGTFTASGATPLASEAEALAGTNNTKIMTPLRVAEAIPSALNASGIAPIYACRAWVNFNGTGTVAIRNSGNVSSITDNGTGDYTVNFTTVMPDANYSVQVTTQTTSSGSALTRFVSATANAYRFVTTDASGTPFDIPHVNVAVFR